MELVGAGSGGSGPLNGQLRQVWVDLQVAYPEPAGGRFVAHGLGLTGRVRGQLASWRRSMRGGWLGVVDHELCDGAGVKRLTLRDQLIPAAALRPVS